MYFKTKFCTFTNLLHVKLKFCKIIQSEERSSCHLASSPNSKMHTLNWMKIFRLETPWSSLPHLVFFLTTKTTKWIWNDFCTILTMFCGHWGLISSLLQKSENYVSWRLGCSIDNLSSFSNSFLEVDAICKEWYVQKLQSQDKMILTFDQIFRNLLRFRYVGQLSFRSKSQKCVRVTLELGEKCSTHCYRINFIYFSPKISAQEFKNHFQINSGRVFRLLCFSTKNSFCPSV